MVTQQPLQNKRQEITVAHHSGPLPPPAMLEEYNKVVPNAAERIIKMAEDQSAHRIKLEAKVISADIRNSTLGIFCALIISIGFLVVACQALSLGQPIAGSIISAIGIGSLVGTFIYGTRSRRHEREQRFNK